MGSVQAINKAQTARLNNVLFQKEKKKKKKGKVNGLVLIWSWYITNNLTLALVKPNKEMESGPNNSFFFFFCHLPIDVYKIYFFYLDRHLFMIYIYVIVTSFYTEWWGEKGTYGYNWPSNLVDNVYLYAFQDNTTDNHSNLIFFFFLIFFLGISVLKPNYRVAHSTVSSFCSRFFISLFYYTIVYITF